METLAIVGCSNRSKRDKGKRFFRLPSFITHQGTQTHELSETRLEEWLARINRKDLKPEQYSNTRICSDHFLSGSPSRLYDRNNPDWAPSVCLGYVTRYDVGSSATERYERAMARKRLTCENDQTAWQ